MPAWLENRAEHILAKNPDMPKSEAYAIGTQQMHSLGKGPRNYGTAEGRATAKAKYDTPGDDTKTANPGGLTSPKMEKKALLERLIRLGATDIPGTPRLMMKHRSPEELATLQGNVTGAIDKFKAPLHQKVEGLASKLPGPLQGAARAGGKLLVNHPEILPMQAVPLPGLTPAYLAGKKGLEKLIDRVAPLPKTAAGAPTRGGFLMASDVPPFKAPRLDRGIQKETAFLPDNITYSPGDFKKSKYAQALFQHFDLLCKQAGITTPASQLEKTTRVGAPRATPPVGPSIAAVSKPIGKGTGFGMPGALKTTVGVGRPQALL